MIGYLKGKILSLEESSVILVANNIGWSINVVRAHEFFLEDEIELFVYTNVRENDISLWGFKTSDELQIFKLLLTVSGVGPKSAQSLLDQKGIHDIVFAVANNDYKSIKVSGIGEKTAQKIVIELNGKVSKNFKPILDNKSASGLALKSDKIEQSVYNDAVAALVSLGYRHEDIVEAIKQIDEELTSSQELIKRVLKLL